MLAFRALRHGALPDRCYRVVWAAAAASATINFGHEYATSANVLAGGYVGLLSLFGMVMFDEFLNQFEQGRPRHPGAGRSWRAAWESPRCPPAAWLGPVRAGLVLQVDVMVLLRPVDTDEEQESPTSFHSGRPSLVSLREHYLRPN
jgi:hypothetical protein